MPIPVIEPRPPAILVVEDDADLRDNLGMLFSDAGFRVLPAEGAREAMALLAEADATVVLADSFLGDGTGLDVLRAARRRRRAARRGPPGGSSAAAPRSH